MKRHCRSSIVVLATMTTLALGVATWAGQAQEVVEIADARLKFEINATDEDGGIQVFIDADAWRWIAIFDPDGKRMFQSIARGRFAEQGGTELFMESAEPEFGELSLEELLERFPEGDYQFRGRGLEGERFVGTATLTHDLPTDRS